MSPAMNHHIHELSVTYSSAIAMPLLISCTKHIENMNANVTALPESGTMPYMSGLSRLLAGLVSMSYTLAVAVNAADPTEKNKLTT